MNWDSFFSPLSLRAGQRKCTLDTHTHPNHRQLALEELSSNHNQVPAAGSPWSVFLSLSQYRAKGTGCLFSMQQRLSLARWFVKSSFHLVKIPHPFLAGRRRHWEQSWGERLRGVRGWERAQPVAARWMDSGICCTGTAKALAPSPVV